MNQAKLRELIISYKIKVAGDIGQLSYSQNEIFRDISLRSILLCSDFVIKEDVVDARTGKSLFIKGFIHNWIFNSEFDYEIIDEGKVSPQLEYFLEIDNENKTILIKPKY